MRAGRTWPEVKNRLDWCGKSGRSGPAVSRIQGKQKDAIKGRVYTKERPDGCRGSRLPAATILNDHGQTDVLGDGSDILASVVLHTPRPGMHTRRRITGSLCSETIVSMLHRSTMRPDPEWTDMQETRKTPWTSCRLGSHKNIPGALAPGRNIASSSIFVLHFVLHNIPKRYFEVLILGL